MCRLIGGCSAFRERISPSSLSSPYSVIPGAQQQPSPPLSPLLLLPPSHLPPPPAVYTPPNSGRLPAAAHPRSHKRLLISYDTQPIATQKADYINRLNLGGAMWWELDADAPEETGRALVRTVRERLGGLEWRENELVYPGSSEWRR